MQFEMEKRQQDLAEAQDMIRRLEEQLKLLQTAKEELEIRQNELQVRKLKMHKWVLNGLSLAYKLKRITLLLLMFVLRLSEVISGKIVLVCKCIIKQSFICLVRSMLHFSW